MGKAPPQKFPPMWPPTKPLNPQTPAQGQSLGTFCCPLKAFVWYHACPSLLTGTRLEKARLREAGGKYAVKEPKAILNFKSNVVP